MTNLLHTAYADPARGLLDLLPDDDLTALVKTASGGRIQPVNRKESTTAVLLTCPDVSKLLSYRKLTSHLLLQYLFSQGVAPKGHVSRTQLVVAVIELWNNCLVKKKGATRAKKEEVSKPIAVKQEVGQPTAVKQEFGQPTAVKQENAVKIEPEVQQPEYQTQKDESQLNPINSLVNTSSLSSFASPSLPSAAYNLYSSSNGCPAMDRLTNSATSCNPLNIDSNASVASASYGLQSSSQQTSTSVVRVMSDEFSIEFCDWFYTMLNRLQPECSNQPGDTLRPDIFCSNCKTEMYLVEGGRQEECKADGSVESERAIRQLLLNLKLLFAPNTADGTQARKSSHGMIQLFCCGTLHCGSSFIGIFEQEFGLVVSPIDKAWKIAYTKVNLKKMNSIQTPSLPKCEVFAIEM